MSKGLVIFGNTAGQNLASSICRYMKCTMNLDINLGEVEISRFADKEVRIQLHSDVRRKHVFIIASTEAPAENIIEACLLANAARNASAEKVIMVIPYLGYNRQDRKDKPRVAHSAQVIINMLKADIDHALLFDVHSEVTAGFFSPAIVDHLYSSAVFIPHLRKILDKDDFVVASPDTGGAKRADAYSRLLNSGEFVIFYKRRTQANKIDNNSTKIVGEVEGKTVVFVDDIIDTGGTIMADVEAAKKAGAKKIIACAAHGVLSGEAVKKLDESPLDRLLVTDSVIGFQKKAHRSSKLEVISTDRLLAEAIQRIHDGRSVSTLILST